MKTWLPTAAPRMILALLPCFASDAAAATGPLLVKDEASPPTAGVLSPTEACALEPGPIHASDAYRWSGDTFTSVYWRIPQLACAACAGQGLNPTTVQFRVHWSTACTVQSEVSIVGVTGPPNCRVPDPNHVLCGPVTQPIVGTASTTTLYALSAPTGCCIDGDAFVRVRFVGIESCNPGGTSPGIAATSTPCVDCEEYVTTAVLFPSATSWCTIAPIPLSSLWVRVATECCAAVGVNPQRDGAGPSGISVVETFSRRVRLAVLLAGSELRPVQVDAFDISGRRVRTVLRDDLDGGRHLVDWDGTSDSGERLPAGVYKLRLRDGRAHAVATAVLLD